MELLDSWFGVKLLLGILVVASIVPVYLRVKDDYHDFLSLGPGGTPQTITGYLKVKVLGLFALSNPYELCEDQEEECQLLAPGHLAQRLPQRPHSRPVTKGIAPHRQTTQRATADNYARLAAALEGMATSSGKQFEVGTSCFEKHGTGIFSTSTPDQRTCRGEICHAHPSDGSLHLTLHPADVKVVLETGWGERHPLARGGFFERFVPHGFLMIYAPQTEDEIQVILQIVAATARFVCGSDMCDKTGACGLAGAKQSSVKLAHPGDQDTGSQSASRDPLKVSVQKGESRP